MDHHIHEAKQNADGRLITVSYFCLGRLCRPGSGRDTGSLYQELHHDLQHLSGV